MDKNDINLIVYLKIDRDCLFLTEYNIILNFRDIKH